MPRGPSTPGSAARSSGSGLPCGQLAGRSWLRFSSTDPDAQAQAPTMLTAAAVQAGDSDRPVVRFAWAVSQVPAAFEEGGYQAIGVKMHTLGEIHQLDPHRGRCEAGDLAGA